MSQNVLFCFSGTGNSLRVCQDIADLVGDTAILPMRPESLEKLDGTQQRVGFVYPVYYGGLPAAVGKFLDALPAQALSSAYVFAIATYGGAVADGIVQAKRKLAAQDIALSYGNKIKMVANFVALYDMTGDVRKAEAAYGMHIAEILADIKQKYERSAGYGNPLLALMHGPSIRGIASKDSGFEVSADCTHCGICEDVCPADNIRLVKGRPAFQHHCEYCMACIQHCPVRAINAGDKTKKRGRYQNPEIGSQKLAALKRGEYGRA